MSRFYKPDGTVLNDCGLKDARENGYCPSVTSIIKEAFPRSGLQRWIEEQLMLQAVANPPIDGEPPQSWFARVRHASDEKRDTAGDWGSRLHDALEKHLLFWGSFGQHGLDKAMCGWTDPFMQWVDENVAEVVWTERVLTHPCKWYAGRADAHFILKDGRLALPDFKNQDLLQGTKRPNWYIKEWTAQLAAYTRCSEFSSVEDPNSIACFSIVFDRSKPSMPVIREWTAEEIHSGWLLFYDALMFWKRINNFYPEPTKWLPLAHLGEK